MAKADRWLKERIPKFCRSQNNSNRQMIILRRSTSNNVHFYTFHCCNFGWSGVGGLEGTSGHLGGILYPVNGAFCARCKNYNGILSTCSLCLFLQDPESVHTHIQILICTYVLKVTYVESSPKMCLCAFLYQHKKKHKKAHTNTNQHISTNQHKIKHEDEHKKAQKSTNQHKPAHPTNTA